MNRFIIVKPTARVVNNLSDISVANLVGDESTMDIAMASMREYINVHQKLKVLGWSDGEHVATYLSRMRILSNATLLIATNAASFMHSAARANIDQDKRLFLGFSRVAALYAIISTFADEAPISDVFDEIVKPSETILCQAKSCPDDSHPNAYQVVTMPGKTEPYTIVPQGDLNGAALIATDGEKAGLAKTFGCSMICIAKTVLFRQAHHIQQDEIYDRQYNSLENALGVATETQRMRLANFTGRLETSRTMAHPFMGSVISDLCSLLGDTERQAIQIRVKGYGAGWAKIGLVQTLWSRMMRDKALSTYMVLRLGEQIKYLKTIVVAFGLPEEEGPTAEYCMVVGGFKPDIGGTPPTWVRNFLDSHSTYIQAALDSIGGTVAGSRTFSKQAGEIGTERKIIKTLRSKLASDLTPDILDDVLPDIEARNQLITNVAVSALVNLNDVQVEELDDDGELAP